MAIKQYDIAKFSLNEKIDFFGFLSNYLDASLPISSTFFKMLEYSGNLKIKNVARTILKEIDGGHNFADCILKFEKPLGGIYCNLLAVGAMTGELPEILSDINSFLLKQRDFKANVIKSCAYPGILLLMLIASLLLLLFFIQPRLAAITDMNSGTYTHAFCLGKYINIFIFIPVLIAGIIFFIKSFKNLIVSKGGIELPILGGIIKNYNLSSFLRLLSISYKAGIPVTQAILCSAAAIPNKYMSNTLLKCSSFVTKRPIAKVFASTGFFTPNYIMKIESGDMSGNLDKVFREISETINLNLETAITSALKLLEPILLVLMGCAVGYYAYSVMGSVYGSLLSF